MEYDRETVKKLAKDVSDIKVSASLCTSFGNKVVTSEEILAKVFIHLEDVLKPFKDLISEAAADQTKEGERRLAAKKATPSK